MKKQMKKWISMLLIPIILFTHCNLFASALANEQEFDSGQEQGQEEAWYEERPEALLLPESRPEEETWSEILPGEEGETSVQSEEGTENLPAEEPGTSAVSKGESGSEHLPDKESEASVLPEKNVESEGLSDKEPEISASQKEPESENLPGEQLESPAGSEEEKEAESLPLEKTESSTASDEKTEPENLPSEQPESSSVSEEEAETLPGVEPETSFLADQESEPRVSSTEAERESWPVDMDSTAEMDFCRGVFDSLDRSAWDFYWIIFTPALRARLNESQYEELKEYLQSGASDWNPERYDSERRTGAYLPFVEEENNPVSKVAKARMAANAAGEYVAVSGMYTLGNTVNLPSLNRNNKDVWMLTLDGEAAFCLDIELKAHSQRDYTRTGISDDETVRQAVAFYTDTPSDENFEYSQLYIWSGGNMVLYVTTMFDYALSKNNQSLYTPQKLLSMDDMEKYMALAEIDGGYAVSLQNAYESMEAYPTQNLGKVYVFTGPAGYQRLATLYRGRYTGEEPDPETEPEPEPVKPEYGEVSAVKSRSSQRKHQVILDRKYASVTGESLAGAVFEVYEGESRIGSITTDAQGKGTLSWNAEGLGSASVSKRYCVNYADLDEETRASVECYHSREEAYAAAEAEADALAREQADRAADLSRTVRMRETSIPPGFSASGQSEWSGVIAGEGSLTFCVENRPWRARVTLDKIDGLTGSRLTGAAEFSVLEWNGSSYEAGTGYQMIRLSDGTYTVKSSKNGAESGYIYYTQKNSGKFCIRETKAPGGYTQDTDSVYIQITADHQEIRIGNANPKKYTVQDREKFANQPWRARITLDKVDGLTGSRLTGAAEFAVLEWNGSVYEANTGYQMIRLSDGTYTVKSNQNGAETGYVYYTQKNSGKFCIRETKAPGGYMQDTDTVYIQITGNHQEIRVGNANPKKYTVQDREKFANQPWRARVMLDKVDGLTGSRLSGAAEFAVLEWNGSVYEASTGYQMIRLSDGTYTVKSNQNGAETGYVYYTQKNSGKFCIRETKAPDGYSQDTDPVYFQITGNGQEIRLANANPKKYAVQNEKLFANNPWKARVILDKVNGLTGERLTKEAEFIIQEWNGSAYENSAAYRMVRLSDGTYTVACQSENAETGYVYYTEKNAGKFRIQETKAPDGYLRDTTPVCFEITQDGQVIRPGNAKPEQYAIQNGEKFANQPWKARVILDKVDGQSGSRLTKETAFTVLEWNGSSYEASAAYRMVRLTDGTYTVESRGEDTETGYLYYTEKNAGKFGIQEVKAPEGYLRDKAPVYFQITQDGQVIRPGNANPKQYAIQNGEKFANQPAHVRIRIPKADRYSNNPIAGEARFGVYDETGKSLDTVTFQKQPDGSYLSSEIYYADTAAYANSGRFYVTEETAPDGYRGDWMETGADDSHRQKNRYAFQVEGSLENHGQVLSVTNDDSGTAFWNEPVYGKVTLYKYDSEAQADQNGGGPITQGDVVTLDGAVYGLYAAEPIAHPDGVTGILYHRDELAAEAVIGRTPRTDARGWLLDEDGRRCAESGKEAAYEPTPGRTAFMQIIPGRYYIQELVPPDGYLPDTTVYRGQERTRYEVTIRYGSEADEVLLRTEKSGQDKNSLTVDDAGTGHEIYSGDFVKKQAVQFIKLLNRNTDTEALPAVGAGFSLYRLGALSGVTAGEIVPDKEMWTGADMKKFLAYDFTGEETVRLYKRQSEPWTEADRKWLTATGERDGEYRVREMFSDENGYFCTPELPVGQYILVETTVPDGRRMADPVLVTVTKDSAMAQPIRYIGNDTTEVYIRIQKTDRDSREAEYNTVYKPGACYRIRLLGEKADFDSTVWHVDPDGFLWYYNAFLRTTCGTEENPFAVTCEYQDGKITDAYVELEPLLPAGRYELIETHAPQGYVINGKEQTLIDRSEEGKTRYQTVESPEKPLVFEISNAVVYPGGQMGDGKNVHTDAYGRQVIVIEQENREQRGVVEIYKTGEQLFAAEQTGSSLQEKLGESPFGSLVRREEFTAADQSFVYRQAPVAGAVFEICAAEDIYTQQLEADRLDYYADDLCHFLVWEKDQAVGRITTDKTGYGYLSGLYIGRYYIREVTAGEGFVRNDRVEFFSVTACEPSQSILVYESHYENERQRVEISAAKQDADDKKPLAGAVFGLYNADEIVSGIAYDAASDSYRVSSVSRSLLPAGTLIGTAVTGEDGIARFEPDIPLGRYEIRELQAPLGYAGPEPGACIRIDARYGDQETAVQVYGSREGILFTNQKTKHIFTKSDFTSGALLNGALLEVREIVLDEKGNPRKDTQGNDETILVDSWVSDREEIHYFYEEGTKGETDTETGDAFWIEIPSPEALPQGKTLIERKGHLIEGLKAGVPYIFREITAPPGYVGYLWSGEEVRDACREENGITEEIRFTVADRNIVASHEMKNQRVTGSLVLTKEGEVLTDTVVSVWDSVRGFFETVFCYVTGRVAEARFEVRVREDIYAPDGSGAIAVYERGEEKTELYRDSLVAEMITGSDGYARLEGLPLGSYYITETGAGEGSFVLNDRIAEITLSYAGQEVLIVTQDSEKYVNERQRVSVSVTKRPRMAENEEQKTGVPGVAGAVFGLYNRDAIYGFEVDPLTGAVTENPEALLAGDTLLERIPTGLDGTARFAADLPCGRYYLRELEAPCGYLLSEEEIEVDASYRGPDEAVQNLSFDFYDEPLLVRISKVDGADGSGLPGALLQIRERNGNIVEEWVTDGSVHTVSGLKAGKTYILSEQTPAAGYATAKEIVFVPMQKTGEDGRLLQEATVWVKTGEGENPPESLPEQPTEEIVMVDKPIQVLISKTDITTGQPVEGARLTVRNAAGEPVESWITGIEPHRIEKLPAGWYTLTEESVPEGSGYSLAGQISFEVKDTDEIQEVGMENDYIRLQVRKVSAETKILLPGAVLLLEFLPDDGEAVPVEEFTTTEEEKIFVGLQPGRYRLTELRAPRGFLPVEPIIFTVTEDCEMQEIVMVDEPQMPPPKIVETPPEETTPEETTPEETTPEETTPEETMPEETIPEETTPEETTPEETTPEETTPEEIIPEETTPEETTLEETTPEETIPEETTPEETTPEETIPEETISEETTPEETTPEETRPKNFPPEDGYGDGGGDTGDRGGVFVGILFVAVGLAALISTAVKYREREEDV